MTSKKTFIILLTFMVAVIAIGEDGANVRDRAKRSMARRSAAKRVIEDIDSLDSDKGADKILLNDEMTKAMFSNVKAHKSYKASMKLCESVVRKTRRIYFDDQLKRAVAAAQEHSPLNLEASEVLRDVGKKWDELVNKKISEFVEKNYDDMFKNARESAIAVQRRLVDKGINYPSSDEIDKALTGLKKQAKTLNYEDFKGLADWIRKFTSEDVESVFDENIAYVDSLGGKVLNNISDQFSAQIEVVESAVSSISKSKAAVTAESAKDEIISEVKSFIEKRQKKAVAGDVPVCDVFEIVDQAAASAAAQLEAEKYIAYLNSLKKVPVSESDIEEDIMKNKGAYRTVKQGVDKLINSFSLDLKHSTATDYAKKLKGKTEDYVEYFENMLNKNADIAKSYNSRVRELITEKAAPIREKIAEADYDKYFSSLSDGELLNEKFVEYAHDNRKRFPVKDIKNLTKMFKQSEDEELKNLNISKTVLLEETQKKLFSVINTGVIAGSDALGEQLRIVHEMEKSQFKELEEDIADGRELTKILEEWGDDLEDNWKKYSKDNQIEYSKIFTRTSELLNKTVRQFYESVEQAEKKSAQSTSQEKTDIDYVKETEASLQPGEEEEEEEQTDGGGGGAGAAAALGAQASEMAVSMDLKLEEVDCLMILDNSRLFRCDAKLITQDGQELTTVRISPRKVDKSSDNIHGSVKDVIEGLLEKKKLAGKKDPEFKMFVVIKSDDIRHKMSIMLMQKIRGQVDEWSANNMPKDNPIKLLWSVGF